MARKIIHLTPDQLGYKDRGKMKWLGLILSDHAEAIYQTKEDDIIISLKPRQTLAEISEILSEAYLLKKPVAIQANILKNGSLLKDIPCLVSGVLEDKIFLVLKDGRIVHTTLDDIRNIVFIAPEIWYQSKKTSLH